MKKTVCFDFECYLIFKKEVIKDIFWRIYIATISHWSGKPLVYVISSKSLYTSHFENVHLSNISAIIGQNSVLTSLTTFNYFNPYLVRYGDYELELAT